MIVKYPDPILKRKSDSVSLEEGKKIVAELKESIAKYLTWGKVLGLAAPQIGHNKRVFIALDKVYINPVITFWSTETYEAKEGCYSLQKNKYDHKVTRHKNIKMEYMDEKGRQKSGLYSGLHAQVLQHEFDHLEGKLCHDNSKK